MWGAPPAQGAQGAVGAGQDDGGLIWVPLGDGLAHPSQQAGQQARPAAVPETLPFAPPLGLQAAGAPAAALNGFQQLDAALLQPLPSLPMPSGDASAGGTGQPAGASSAATTEAVDKQAVAREKNRLAQRRFRCVTVWNSRWVQAPRPFAAAVLLNQHSLPSRTSASHLRRGVSTSGESNPYILTHH